MIPKRRRATAIILRPEGILLTGMRFMAYSLPGGGIGSLETPEQAVIREVWEETTLTVMHAVLLFEYNSYAHHHFVFRVEVEGVPRANQEIQSLAYYPTKIGLKISHETSIIIKQFLSSWEGAQ